MPKFNITDSDGFYGTNLSFNAEDAEDAEDRRVSSESVCGLCAFLTTGISLRVSAATLTI
ncbi:hypothetical protein QUF72_19735 [Desulfobacterales bacterium HSG2]|nr:hypothetical protein [Desulfobacterales bacterium HSG2]